MASQHHRSVTSLESLSSNAFFGQFSDALLDTIRKQFIMSITDDDANIVEVNDAFCAISQYSRNELIGANHRIVNSGHHTAEFFGEMWRQIRAGDSWRGEICNRAKDGTHYWVDSVIAPLPGPDGRIDRFVSIRSDITARREELEDWRDRKIRLRRLLDATPAMLHSIDSDGRLWTVSDRWLTKLGYQRDEVIGKQASEFMTPKSREDAAKLLPQLLSAGHLDDVEFQMVCKDGRLIDVLLSAVFEQDETGKPSRSSTVLVDITRRKQTERQLALSEARYKALVDEHSEMVSLVAADSELTYVNRAFAAHFGRNPDQMVGTFFYDHIPERERPTARQLLQNACALKGMTSGETLIPNASGESRWIAWINRALIDHDGQVSGIHLVGRDITARKRIEMELQRANQIFSIAANAAGMGFWDWNISSNVLTWDEGMFRLYGRARTDGQQAYEVWASSLHPDDRERCEQEGRDAIQGVRPYRTEFRIIHPGGQIRHLMAAATIVVDPDGRDVHLLGVNFDITERKKTEIQLNQMIKELKRINTEVENFAYVASHDLKAPMRGVDNLAHFIADELGDSASEDIRENLHLIHSRIGRMTMLMDDLLAFSRAGEADGEIVKVDTLGLVNELFELMATTKPIRLQASADLPVLHTHKAPLELVFRNLIGNAIKHHNKAHGIIRISAQAIAEGFEFSVSDDGPGIPPEQQQRVFGMFQKLKSGGEVEGSGIGLAIVRKTVESMNGTVTLESDGAHGCDFRFTWPANIKKPDPQNGESYKDHDYHRQG